MSETDPIIHSPELAHIMGYAGKPYRELAQAALTLGLDDSYATELARADGAEFRAAKEYLSGISDSLTAFERRYFADRTDETSVIVTQYDFEQFGLKASPRRGYSTPLIVWNILTRAANNGDLFQPEDVKRLKGGHVASIRLDDATVERAGELPDMGPVRVRFLERVYESLRAEDSLQTADTP